MSAVLKIFAIFACALAGASFVLAILARWKSSAAWLARQSESISNAADMAGLDLSRTLTFALSPMAPAVKLILSMVRKKRLARIDSCLADALSLIQGALKAGLTLPQALELAAAKLSGPFGFELRRAVSEIKLGRTVEEALGLMAGRIASDDVGLIVQSVEVLRRTGGNLIETFGTLRETIEGRHRVEDRIRVLTSQGVYQCIMLTAMPWLLCLALHALAPDYLSPLFSTRMGLAMVISGIALEAIGAVWLKYIVVIKV